MPISVIILTFNSQATIGETLRSARQVSDDVHVVDSYSSDKTRDIAEQAGAGFVQHPFENYGAQRNWAIENLALKHDWQLHLDADERLTDALIDEIRTLDLAGSVDGFFIPRLVHFMSRPIRHGGMYPIWHLRLFRHGKGRCESRRYDQHFFVDGSTAQLQHPFIDDIRMSLGEWTTRHNRWSDAEVEELLDERTEQQEGLIQGRYGGTPVERQRARRAGYERFPLFLRAFLLFLYRYVFRLGFLDGREGLIFFVLQSFWFRFLIDAKLFEHRQRTAHNKGEKL